MTASPVCLAKTPNSASVCPSISANRCGESPASVPPTMSTVCTAASPSWNNTPQNNAGNSQNATTNSTRHGPPTASS